MKIVTAVLERHAEAIRETLNREILTGTAFYRSDKMTKANIRKWFKERNDGNFPILCAEDDDGSFLGFATCSSYHPYPAYRYSVEASLYVVSGKQHQGVGTALVEALTEECRKLGIHTLVAVIDRDNIASMGLCRKAGFVYTGFLEQIGRKFDEWRDVAFFQKIL